MAAASSDQLRGSEPHSLVTTPSGGPDSWPRGVDKPSSWEFSGRSWPSPSPAPGGHPGSLTGVLSVTLTCSGAPSPLALPPRPHALLSRTHLLLSQNLTQGLRRMIQVTFPSQDPCSGHLQPPLLHP